MSILSQRDLFPLIAESIRSMWATKRDWVRRDEIVDALLQDSYVRDRLTATSLPPDREPRWYVGNAVDWFSHKFTVGQSDYIAVFERTKIQDKWAYRLRDGALPPPEVKTYAKFEELGRGGFGVVYRGEILVNGDSRGSVAIKTYLSDFDEAEYQLLRSLDHPCIVKLLDRYDDKDLRGNSYTCMVLEYADGGSLDERIRGSRNGLPSLDVWAMVLNVARALEYLHSRVPRVLHRDVKPRNILFFGGNAKLSDVGIAKLIDTTTVTHSGIQTLAYAAPEMLPLGPGDKPVVSAKVDVYALGLTAFAAFAGGPPWGRPDPATLMWHHHNSTIPLHPNIDDAARRALRGMTAKRYEERWTAAQVVTYAESVLKT